KATDIARKMVCEWGMSEKLGPVTFGKKDEQVFLGMEIAKHKDYSEKTAEEIDDEIKKIVMQRYEYSKRLLIENRALLEKLASALLERETLTASEIDAVIQGREINTPEPAKPGEGKGITMEAKADATTRGKEETTSKPVNQKKNMDPAPEAAG
ncbi:MAG: cell division protein FtsH, partial [Candidatus Mariimomonas ferrooxydans]